jgi:hypothetical protein
VSSVLVVSISTSRLCWTSLTSGWRDHHPVVNLAQMAVDDSVTTTRDTPVTIAVTANDQNPDPTRAIRRLWGSIARRGTGRSRCSPMAPSSIRPPAGFVGQDHFQYGLCDNVVSAAGTADCGIATVIVTVNPGTPTTSTTGPRAVLHRPAGPPPRRPGGAPRRGGTSASISR